MNDTGKLAVCCNGACPICRAEKRLHSLGLSGARLFRRLHAATADHRILGGVAAFSQVWERAPSYRWLARLVNYPIPRCIAEFGYERLAAPLHFHLNLRRQRRAGSGSG